MYRTRKPIYGCKNPTKCDPEPLSIPLLTLFRNIITSIADTVDKFFPAGRINAPLTADMNAKAYIPPSTMVRLLWIRQNPCVRFDVNNMLHLNQIKDLYLQIGCDWGKDILFANQPRRRRRRGALL